MSNVWKKCLFTDAESALRQSFLTCIEVCALLKVKYKPQNIIGNKDSKIVD